MNRRRLATVADTIDNADQTARAACNSPVTWGELYLFLAEAGEDALARRCLNRIHEIDAGAGEVEKRDLAAGANAGNRDA